MSAVLAIRNLEVRFTAQQGEVCAVSDLDLDVQAGECLGVVGESGAGKTQLFLAVLGLLAGNGRVSGSARFGGVDLLSCARQELNAVRGAGIGVVFQDPMTSLTPHLRIGTQIGETLRAHRGLDTTQARARALELLERVGVTDPARRLQQYPHELSGGMRQRVMIASALACQPALLIADEPTTALDVTIEAQLLELFRELKRELGTALVLITHDLGVVAGLADRVAVMYAGRVVEQGAVDAVLRRPRHPYTAALLQSMPHLDWPLATPLKSIAGQPPQPDDRPSGCAFVPRCQVALEKCATQRPALEGHDTAVACHNPLRTPPS